MPRLLEDGQGGKGTMYFTLVLLRGLGWEDQAAIGKLKHRTDEMEKRIRELGERAQETDRRRGALASGRGGTSRGGSGWNRA